jgi:hypothetical protein
MSAVATNPSTLLGFGTWVAFGAGKMPVSFSQGDPDFGTLLGTGGTKTGTPTGSVTAPTFTGTSAINTSLVSAGTPAGTNSVPTFTGGTDTSSAVSAGTPAGTVAAPVFTGSALATHSHELPFGKTAGGTGQLEMIASSIFGTGTSRAPESISAAPTANTTSIAVLKTQAITAGTPAGTNSAPAFTGSALGTHQHTTTATGTVAAPTFTGSALGTHQHTLTPAGTNSAPVFSGTSMAILPPFIVINLWQRTA